MGQAPAHRHLHRTIHRLPARAEGVRHLLPRQQLGPRCQKPLVGPRQLALAFGPRQPLYLHPATWAVDTPRRVQKKHPQRPQRHELIATLRQTVITGAGLVATRADRPTVGPLVHRHLQGRTLAVAKTHGAVNKRLVPLDAIKDSLNLHPDLTSRVDGSFPNSSISADGSGCTSFSQGKCPHLAQTLPRAVAGRAGASYD